MLPCVRIGLFSTPLVADNLNMFAPVSPSAESISTLSVLVLAICGIILLVVWLILLYCLARFRQRGASDSTEPPQVYGSMPIEIAWTAAPTLIVFVLMLVVVRTINEVHVDLPKPPPGSEPLEVTVIGHQWWWEYVYEGYAGKLHRFTAANELHVPASTEGTPRPVYLRLESADVCHSYWVPRLAGKVDLIPGRRNHLWFQTMHTGLFLGQCAEYCGTQHAHMLLRVNVDAPDDFARWLANQEAPAVEDPAARKGRDVFFSQTCVNCHTIRGTSARGTVAPDLTHLMSRETIASGMIENNRANLRRWVIDPQTVKPGCLMAGFALPQREIDLLVDYLMTLK